jgi:hypothetical protein
LCRQRKIKEKDYRRRFFHDPRRRCTTKLCPTIWRNPGAADLLRVCTNASMGEWCSHAPTKFCGAQRSLCGAICTPSSTTTKCGHIGGYAVRNMQIIAAILNNANQMGEGNTNIAYALGHLHLAPSYNS